MQQELGNQDHRQQARAGKAARNGMRWRRRLGDRLAIPAGELLAHMLDDFPAARFAFQCLGHDLAKLVQPRAAAFATGARRVVRRRARPADCPGSLRGPRGARARLSVGSGCDDLRLRFFVGLRLFQILDGQFELLDEKLAAFGGLAERSRRAFASISFRRSSSSSRTCSLRSLAAIQHLALREDHRVRAGEIVGSRSEKGAVT